MDLCDNVFCTGEIVEFEYVPLAGRRFCCVACADAWSQQNEVLMEAAMPFREPKVTPGAKPARLKMRMRFSEPV